MTTPSRPRTEGRRRLAANGRAPAATDDPGHPPDVRGVVLSVLGGAGMLAGVMALAMELSDAEPHAQMWVSTAAGTAFLAAAPWASTDGVRGWTVRARLLVGAGMCSVLAVASLWRVLDRSEPRVLFLLVPTSLVFVTAGLAVREANLMGERLQRNRLLHQMQGRETERRRWAQELHDQTLQDLAAIDVVLAELVGRPAAQGIREELVAVRERVREEIVLTRYLINELRPLTLDVLGLAPALKELGARTEDVSDVTVHVDVDELPEALSPDAQLAVYRIVQEALTNAVRHAECSTISVSARRRRDALVVEIRDDGIGVSAAAGVPSRSAGGRGRLGMLERASAMGGSVAWSDGATAGTRVVLSLPLHQIMPADRR